MIPTLKALPSLALAAIPVLTGSVAEAQLNNSVPKGTEGVGIVQRVGEELPLSLPFTDHLGQQVRLGDYFEPGRPTFLTLNYGDCPMLCVVQLDGVVALLDELEFEVGDDFQIVTVSIDPTESVSKAQATRDHYLQRYSRGLELTDDQWPFLTGSQASIDSLADALGFGFRFLPETGEYAHDAALMLATPDGVISRYFFGINYDPKTVRLSLVEASAGRLGGIADQFSLLCFVYDHEAGVYTATAVNLMRIGAMLTMLILGGFLFSFWRKDVLAALSGRRESSSAGRPLEGVS
ncbi:MAG: SCO family protein [Planctomycetota bacterium]|jgi:protein SCO1/2